MKTQLYLHEWLAVLSILVLIVVLAVISTTDEPALAVPHGPSKKLGRQTVLVTIRGAVQNPGEYELPLGSYVADLLKIAEPLPSADLRRLNTESKLRNGRDIYIREYPSRVRPKPISLQ
jgi:DNA uptake protein ComE-like DNA-binding protein